MNTLSGKTKRNSNIELLRIFSMIMIIAYHSVRNFDISAQTVPAAVNSTLIVLGSWGILGVDLFIIISAWFLNEQKFHIKRIINIAFQVFTYVILFYILFFVRRGINGYSISVIISDFIKFEIKDFFQPLWCNYYWFITAYFFMVISSPILNRLIQKTSESQMKKILLIFIFIPIYAQFSTSTACDAVYFMYLYLMIGYLKKYPKEIIFKSAKLKWIVPIIALVLISKFATLYVKTDLKIFYIITQVFYNTISLTNRHSLIILIISILLFYFTINLRPTYNRFTNTVSGCTLGVYLLHENHIMDVPNVLNSVFDKLKLVNFFSNNYLFIFQFSAVVLSVFIVCTIIEFIRKKLIQDPIMKWLDKKDFRATERIDNWFNNF